MSRPLSDGLEPHMAAMHPISLWKQVPSRGSCSSIAAWVSPSPRAPSVDLTACCHHLCGCGGSRSSTPPPCYSLPLGLAMDPGFLTARSVTQAGSLQLLLFLLWPWGTAGRSSGPQLCDTPQAPMAQLQGGFVQRSPSPWEGREEQPHLPQASSALPCVAHQQDLLSSSLPCTSCIPVPLVPQRSSWFGCWESSCLQGSCAAWHRGLGGVGWWATCRKLS